MAPRLTSALRPSRHGLPILAFAALFVSLLSGTSSIQPYPALAAGIAVGTLSDELDGDAGNGDCSLREALENANSNDEGQADCAPGAVGTDTIDLTGLTETIALTLGGMGISDDVIISGPGADMLTLDGGAFGVNQDVTATISGLTLTNGSGVGVDGNLVMRGVSVTANASEHGAGIYVEAGGTLTLTTRR